ncbi:MAG: patatin-like phospholipase family protein [Gammaproteobacteria bacterium]|nr:patatin-like phospholipase family protein [Gammaproteobacteria bacterium]
MSLYGPVIPPTAARPDREPLTSTTEPVSARFQILSLCGGGYRGLYTARVLELMERHFERPIAECFDLIAGTSVGGILAIGLVSGRSAAQLREALQDAGPRVFGRNGLLQRIGGACRTLIASKHDGRRLREMIQTLLDASLTLADAQRALVVPAVNLTTGRTEIFKTPHAQPAHALGGLALLDVAVATAAAPVFFAPARVLSGEYVDGGMVANAPDAIALHEAEHALGQPTRDVFMLSVGTTFPPAGATVPKRTGGGLAFWLREHRLLELSLSAQQSLAQGLCKERLGERLLTVNWAQSHRQTRHLAMDVADAEATRTLLSLADASYAQTAMDGRLHQFMAHRGLDLAALRTRMGLH